MSKRLLFFALLIMYSKLNAQDTLKLGDGSEVPFTIISTDFKDAKPFNIFLREITQTSSAFLQFGGSYYKYNEYLITSFASYSFRSIGVTFGGAYFLKNWEKTKNRKVILLQDYSGNDNRTHKLRFPAKITNHIGPHISASLSRFNFNNYQEKGELNAGLCYIWGRFLKLEITRKNRIKSMMKTVQTGIYADYYFKLIEIDSNYSGPPIKKMGFKLYLQGKSSFRQMRDFGCVYTVGFSFNGMIGGIGLYAGF